MVGTATVAPTGGWETWVNVTGTVTPPSGTGTAVPGVHRRRGRDAVRHRLVHVHLGRHQPPTGTNLALNKPATASSVESAAYPASAAVDASATTRWASAFADPQWIQVDLGQSYSIDRVRLTWEAAYGSAYQIQTSTERHHLDHGPVGHRRQRRRGRQHRPERHRPVRADQRHRPRHGVGLLAVRRSRSTAAAAQPPTATNVALNKPATASSVESAAFPASAAVDASATTRWASAFADPQWIQVDLGQSYSISRVRLIWEAAYGSAYQIQTSAERHHLDHGPVGDRRQRR